MATKKKSSATRVTLPGSEKKQPSGKKRKAVVPNYTIEVTVRIRRKKDIDNALKELIRTGKTYTREEYQQEFGLNDGDVKKVEAFAAAHELSVTQTSYGRRSMVLRGTAENMEKAFGVKLNYYQQKDGKSFRGRSGAIKVPKELAKIVTGVFGLDDRQQAKPHFKRLKGRKVKPHAHGASFNPNELATLYNYPKADGNGQCIAIIELGGGHKLKDIKHYFDNLGLPVPVVKSIAVGGAHNSPGVSADGEVMLDIEVAGAIAPKATIVMYYAHNTDKGFLDAITQAVHDNVNKPSVISISWGAAEKEWTKQSMTNFNEAFKAAALLGVTVCAAAGDSGSADDEDDGKAHADFPASSPFVLACGGTKLTTANGKTVSSEVVWHEADDSATGGGVSEFFALPDYQKTAKIPKSVNNSFVGRGLPDVSGVADPKTGYKVYVDGVSDVYGGTSAVAPLMAGLIARINQLKKKSVGFIHPAIYKNPAVCRDITVGDNITTSTGKGYTAGTGWDGCTGLGVADGKKLLNIL